MIKKTIFAVLMSMMTTTLVPTTGLCWHHPHHGSYHHGHHGDALAWGLGGLVLGTIVTAAILQPRPPMAYAAPPSPTYTYRPDIPPGMCRWERFVLDGYGRTLLDQYGQPVKEYTIGSCQYPPN